MFLAGPKSKNPPAGKPVPDFHSFAPGIIIKNMATEETQIVAEEASAVETSEVLEATDYTEPADAAQDTVKSSETNPHTLTLDD